MRGEPERRRHPAYVVDEGHDGQAQSERQCQPDARHAGGEGDSAAEQDGDAAGARDRALVQRALVRPVRRKPAEAREQGRDRGERGEERSQGQRREHAVRRSW
jgi:hypothetical protein